MEYHLEQLYSKQKLSISKTQWLKALEFAKSTGWEPTGTVLEFERELDDMWDEEQGKMYNLWMVCISQNACTQWDGNYTDPEDQIITDNDSYELMLSLETSEEFIELAGFIGGTAFRILKQKSFYRFNNPLK